MPAPRNSYLAMVINDGCDLSDVTVIIYFITQELSGTLLKKAFPALAISKMSFIYLLLLINKTHWGITLM